MGLGDERVGWRDVGLGGVNSKGLGEERVN